MNDRRRPNARLDDKPCSVWEEALALHVGGDLAAEEARELERHLSRCSRCTAFLRRLGNTRSVLTTLSDPPPGDSVTRTHRRVMEAVRREASGRRSQRPSPPIASSPLRSSRVRRWAAAAAVLLILGASLVGRLALRRGAPEEAPVMIVAADRPSAVPGAPSDTPRSRPPGPEKTIVPEESQFVPGEEPDEGRALPAPEVRDVPAPPAPHESRSPQPEAQRASLDGAPDLKIKLVSDDPDIVIYWLVETKMEETPNATPTT